MKAKYNIYFWSLLAFSFFVCCDYSDSNPDFLLEAVFMANDERLLNYDAVNETEREPFFIEEFDNNNSQFPYQEGTYTEKTVSVANGKMTIKYFVDNGYMHFKSVPFEIDERRNFEMETSLIVYRGLGQTLAWLPNRASGYEYVITYNQVEDSDKNKIETIRLRKFINDDWEAIDGYDFNAKDFLNSDGFTILTIRKIGNKYAIFINYKLFYIINDENFSCVPAITMDDPVVNVFDYFRIYYLP